MHYRSLLRLGAVLGHDWSVAEELVQESFVRYHRSGTRPRPGAELAYLRRTVINLAHDHHRRAAFIGRLVHYDPAPMASSEDEALTNQQQVAIAAAVRRLPRRQHDCVVLYYFADLSTAEIASTLEISAGSVKTHLHRGRTALAGVLGAPCERD